MIIRKHLIATVTAMLALATAGIATAQQSPGVTATEIKIGQTMPYTGPVAAFSALGKGEIGYFK